MTQTLTFIKTLAIHQDAGPDISDISHEVTHAVKASQILEGTVHITAVGSTGSVTTIEHESGVVQDLKDAINRIAPPDGQYQHELAWHDGNGHSHVQAAVIGPAIVVPVRNGKPGLGAWQQVVAINHDIHARKRIIEITITGVA